jgi:hypothetical protein
VETSLITAFLTGKLGMREKEFLLAFLMFPFIKGEKKGFSNSS